MTATADIETETIENAISVPMQSVTVRKKDEVNKALNPDPSDEGKDKSGKGKDSKDKALADKSEKDERGSKEDLQRIIFVVKDGKTIMREVKTGIADNTYIVIEEGIAEGEKVVSGSYRAITRHLKHEMAVTIKKPDEDKKPEEEKS
jgi:HlyD family secretion protein